MASFTCDLKRLPTHLTLIAYQHGFREGELSEILNVFTQQYIVSVKQIQSTSVRHDIAIGQGFNHVSKRVCLKKQATVAGSMPISHPLHEINWQSLTCVTRLIILAKQVAIAVAQSHCQPPIFPLILNDTNEMSAKRCTQVIQLALPSDTHERILIDEIHDFAMIYKEIAQRDHRLFFKHFRCSHLFQGTNGWKNTRIAHPLANARRVPILIVGGCIGGMAVAVNPARAGIRVRLLERNPEFGEVGAGMQLAPNCSRLLDRLGLLSEIHSNAVFRKQIVWMDAKSGERLASIDLGEKFVEKFQYPYIVVHRADLFQVLHRACVESGMVTMETNRLVTSVDERP
jgi:hypothetical protein